MTPLPAPSVVPLHRSAPATVVRSEPTGPPSPEPAPQAPAPVERTRGPFTLEVGQDLDLQAAFDRRDRVQELVGIEAWVVPSPEGSAEPNRVVLGIYRTRERAESAASMLLRSRTLDQVTVVPLPSRRARR